MSVTVVPLAAADLEAVLPLIEDYQRFYRVEQPDRDRNRAFFRGFLAPSERGLLLGARHDGEFAGFACLYWTYSSVRVTDVVLVNDLFVRTDTRGSGAGRKLLEAAAEVARERDVLVVRWLTEAGNVGAQRLYDRMGAERSAWLEYELPVGPRPTG